MLGVSTEMGMTKIMVTGCRGGCGASTVAAGLACALAHAGKRTVLLDFDLSERSLDMYLGCEDRVVYDLGDLLIGQTGVKKIAVTPQGIDSLYLIPGAYHLRRPPTGEETARVFSVLEQELDADYLVIDASNASNPAVKICAALSDEVLLVVLDTPLAVRSATSLADTLYEWGKDDMKMVVNRFSMTPKNPTDLRALIDETGLCLIGVVPESAGFARLQNEGIPACSAKEGREVVTAFRNMAKRVMGEVCPLLSDIPCPRKKLLDLS